MHWIYPFKKKNKCSRVLKIIKSNLIKFLHFFTLTLIIIKEDREFSKYSTYLIARADRRLRQEVGKKKKQNKEIREGKDRK